ncbi:GPW/gp25 family protein [Enhygromyxa salina]|uniref:Gene 25-like lysozyme n=1 Tax=Enhygromyxa salina TaxID=215803 RepID=A0A2S9YUA8_9BACT|nr:GPW/gp25 family protein [Enhygromyxa salina]PRQ08673.1 Gene 25-like lysozyme [Enhygromyxa salina]
MPPRTRSFITRLTRAEPRPEVEDIASNLGHVLNSRKACAVITDVGLGDYEIAPNARDAVLLLQAEIEQLVRRCEPRMRDASVSLLGRHGYANVRLELQGQLRGVRQLFWLDLNTTTRRVDVSIVGELGR